MTKGLYRWSNRGGEQLSPQSQNAYGEAESTPTGVDLTDRIELLALMEEKVAAITAIRKLEIAHRPVFRRP
jgi:hypothetical protein